MYDKLLSKKLAFQTIINTRMSVSNAKYNKSVFNKDN